jgi:hypothetical protein
MDLDPYVAKPIQRTASLDHEPDCAVIKYGPVVCTCGALNRWLSSSSRGLTNNQRAIAGARVARGSQEQAPTARELDAGAQLPGPAPSFAFVAQW